MKGRNETMIKKYIPLADNGQRENFIKVDTYYNLGGMNYWTGKNERRGYYLMVTPVEKRGIMESVTIFTGIKECIKEVKRQSAKAEAEADEISKYYEDKLIQYVLEKNGLQLKTEC